MEGEIAAVLCDDRNRPVQLILRDGSSFELNKKSAELLERLLPAGVEGEARFNHLTGGTVVFRLNSKGQLASLAVVPNGEDLKPRENLSATPKESDEPAPQPTTDKKKQESISKKGVGVKKSKQTPNKSVGEGAAYHSLIEKDDPFDGILGTRVNEGAKQDAKDSDIGVDIKPAGIDKIVPLEGESVVGVDEDALNREVENEGLRLPVPAELPAELVPHWNAVQKQYQTLENQLKHVNGELEAIRRLLEQLTGVEQE